MCVKQAVGSSCMPERSMTSGYKAAPKESIDAEEQYMDVWRAQAPIC